MFDSDLLTDPALIPVFNVFVFFFGAILGSFANVVIYRMPKDLSVVAPRSRCQSCQSAIKWYDNIPIVSYFVLRGKCRQCGASYSIRYAGIEFLTASLFSLTFFYFGFSWTTLEMFLFIFALVVCVFIDFDHMILPDQFTLSGILIGLVGAFFNPERDFLSAVIGVLVGGGFLWVLAYLYYTITGREGMGGGDIKLLAWIGAVLGWRAIPFVILMSSIVGSIVGIAASLRSKEGLKTVIPFGPYLALGALLFVFGGKTIAYWYFNLFLPEL